MKNVYAIATVIIEMKGYKKMYIYFGKTTAVEEKLAGQDATYTYQDSAATCVDALQVVINGKKPKYVRWTKVENVTDSTARETWMGKRYGWKSVEIVYGEQKVVLDWFNNTPKGISPHGRSYKSLELCLHYLEYYKSNFERATYQELQLAGVAV